MTAQSNILQSLNMKVLALKYKEQHIKYMSYPNIISTYNNNGTVRQSTQEEIFNFRMFAYVIFKIKKIR